MKKTLALAVLLLNFTGCSTQSNSDLEERINYLENEVDRLSSIVMQNSVRSYDNEALLEATVDMTSANADMILELIDSVNSFYGY